MISKFTFLNDHLTWPVLIGAAVILVVFIWKEWTQSTSLRLILKIGLSFIALVALALIALKPAFPTKESAGKMMLLTEGFRSDQLDSLKKEHRNLKVLDYDPEEAVSREIYNSEKIFVLGHGLKKYDLWQLEEAPAVFLGGNSPGGVVKLNYKQENAIGDRLVLKGLYENPEAGKRLVLQGPGGTGLDSVALNAEENKAFELAAELKVEGNYIYSLVEKDSLGAILSTDPVPVKVSEKQQLKMLMVNNFPTFETKYLKNFIAEAGHELLVRSQLTRGRYKYEFFNTNRVPIGIFSKTTLEPLDVLIIDAHSLRDLPAGERRALENSVRENGLGVFIQADNDFFNSPGSFAAFRFLRGNATETRLAEGSKAPVPIHPYHFQEDFALQEIHTTDDKMLTAYLRRGEGRIGTTVLENTYQLLLEGHTSDYQQFWSGVIEKISRKEKPASEWGQESILAFRDEPFDFHLRTEVASPVVKSNGNTIPLIQDVDFPSLWKGTTWPQETGWNRLEQDTTGAFDYYVAESTQWNSITQFRTLQENRRYFDNSVTVGQGHKPLEPVNPLWFFGIFLVCMGVLWLEPKM